MLDLQLFVTVRWQSILYLYFWYKSELDADWWIIIVKTSAPLCKYIASNRCMYDYVNVLVALRARQMSICLTRKKYREFSSARHEWIGCKINVKYYLDVAGVLARLVAKTNKLELCGCSTRMQQVTFFKTDWAEFCRCVVCYISIITNTWSEKNRASPCSTKSCDIWLTCESQTVLE